MYSKFDVYNTQSLYDLEIKMRGHSYLSDNIYKIKNETIVFIFLGGLNDDFKNIRSQILKNGELMYWGGLLKNCS